MNASPFLAVPISARISPDGRLLSADPPLWRLHVLAGGETEGPVAIPGLAALASRVQKTRMRIEQAVRAADEDSDVELWVEATPGEGITELKIIGWREVAPIDQSLHRHQAAQAEAGAAADSILIGPDLKIVRAPSSVPAAAVGRHLGEVFVLETAADGTIPLVDALSERRPVTEELGSGGNRFIFDLTPQFSSDGRYIGHGGTARAVPVHDTEPADAATNTNLPMGRQFASVLKQPLSRIMANADTIGSGMHGPLKANYAEYAQDIANAARHLSELVSDMEDLEAIDRPGFSVARERVELGDISRRVAGLLALKASDHGIRILLPPDTELVEAVGEFRRVLQILLNLVGNAIRYAPGGSNVAIAIEKRVGSASVSVADEGAGVAPGDRERVFEKFERLGRSGDGGSGLGLYISRRLARAMGGELSVETAPSGGALFRLTLPAR